MTFKFSEVISEAYGESAEFWMTEDTKPPKQYYGAFEIDGKTYGMSLVQTTSAKHFTFDFWSLATKNKKYWKVMKTNDWNVVIPTILRFLEMTYTMAKPMCDSIILRVPNTPQTKSKIRIVERFIKRSFVKTMTYVPVKALSDDQKFTNIYLVKKGVDPKSLFNGAVFAKHFTFDLDKEDPNELLAKDEIMDVMAQPYKVQKVIPSVKPSKLAFGAFVTDGDTSDQYGSQISDVTAQLMDKSKMKVYDHTAELNGAEKKNLKKFEPETVAASNPQELEATLAAALAGTSVGSATFTADDDALLTALVIGEPDKSLEDKVLGTLLAKQNAKNCLAGMLVGGSFLKYIGAYSDFTSPGELSSMMVKNATGKWIENCVIMSVKNAIAQQNAFNSTAAMSEVVNELFEVTKLYSVDSTSIEINDTYDLSPEDISALMQYAKQFIDAFPKASLDWKNVIAKSDDNMASADICVGFTAVADSTLMKWIEQDELFDAYQRIDGESAEIKSSVKAIIDIIVGKDMVAAGALAILARPMDNVEKAITGLHDYVIDVSHNRLLKRNINHGYVAEAIILITKIFGSSAKVEPFKGAVNTGIAPVVPKVSGVDVLNNLIIKETNKGNGVTIASGFVFAAMVLWSLGHSDADVSIDAIRLSAPVYEHINYALYAGSFYNVLNDQSSSLEKNVKKVINSIGFFGYDAYQASPALLVKSAYNSDADIYAVLESVTAADIKEFLSNGFVPQQKALVNLAAVDSLVPNKQMAATFMLAKQAMPNFMKHVQNGGINVAKAESEPDYIRGRIVHSLSLLNAIDPVMKKFLSRGLFGSMDAEGKMTKAFIELLKLLASKESNASDQFATLTHIANDAEKVIFPDGAAKAGFTKSASGYTPINSSSATNTKKKYPIELAQKVDLGFEMHVEDEASAFFEDNNSTAHSGMLGYEMEGEPNLTEKKMKYLEKKYPHVQEAIGHLKAGKMPGIHKYTGSSYGDINSVFRDASAAYIGSKGQVKFDMSNDISEPLAMKCLKEYEKYAVAIDEPIWLYRNTSVPGVEKYEVGDDMIDAGFLSTSLKSDMSMGSGSTRMKIFIPAGFRFIAVVRAGSHEGEREIILPPFTVNRITEKVIVSRHPGKYCFTMIAAGTAYKDILENANTDAKKQKLMSEAFDFSKLSLKSLRKIEEATVREDDENPFYNPEGKWADPIADYKTSQAISRILKAKKRK